MTQLTVYRTAVANLTSAETKVLGSLDDVKTTLSVMTVILGKIPLTIGNPMCGGVLADHVWICDGLGQQYYLPINFCNSFDVSHDGYAILCALLRSYEELPWSPASRIQELPRRRTCGSGSF